MSTTREVAQRYMDLLCAGRFAEAFALLAPDVSYTVVGSTPISAPMHGRQTVLDTLVPALASFRSPLRLTFKGLIVDGDRAVGLASGAGVGPTGLSYVQPAYAMVLRVKDGAITEVLEFADTVEIETKLLGKKLVAAAG